MSSLTIAFGIAITLGGIIQGCDLSQRRVILGDPAIVIRVENKTDETVSIITNHVDGKDLSQPTLVLQPNTAGTFGLMYDDFGTGMWIRGVTASGKMALEHYIDWDQIKPGDTRLVITEEGGAPAVTPVKEQD